MNFRHLVVLTLLVVAIGSMVGCLGDDGPPIHPDVFHPVDSTPGTLPPPVLDLGAIPQTTCQDEVGVIGTTQPGASVFATGGAGSGIKTADSSGRFCLPVSLNHDQINTINVYASAGGQTSSPATVRVTHQSSPECQTTRLDGGIAPDPENVALKGTATAMEPPVTGTPAAVIDGDISTTAHWDSDNLVCPWCAYDGWVSVKLEKPTAISKIVVRWRDNFASAEKYFGSEYKVLISSTPDAGSPQLGGVWTTLATVTTGDGGEDVFEYPTNQPIALHVAVWMRFDGASSYDEQFVMAELEVYDTPASNPQPPPPPGVCSSGF